MRTLALLACFVAAAQAQDRKDLKPGVVFTFADRTPGAPKNERYSIEPTVALSLGADDQFHPTLKNSDSVRWLCFLVVLSPGEYRFATNSAGGEVLANIDGKSISLDEGREHRPNGQLSPPIMLKAGVYPFTGKFFRNGSKACRLEVLWQGPGIRLEPIPTSALGHMPHMRGDVYHAEILADRGRFLFEELACQKCHARPNLTDRTGPDLSQIASRTFPGWLDAWLADPAKIRPHTAMPKMFDESPDGAADRYAVVQYLRTLGPALPEPRRVGFSNDYMKSVTAGEALFTTVGCATCHAKNVAATRTVEDDDEVRKADPLDSFHGLGAPSGPQWVYALGAIGSKTTPEQLAKYLQDPMKTNPHGRMPNMNLTGDEARDVARHLTRQTDDNFDRAVVKKPAAAEPAGGWAARGKELFVSKGCINCHAAGDLKPSLKGPEIKSPKAGCVAAKPDAKKVPVYSLTDDKRDALAAYLAGPKDTQPAPTFAAKVALTRFGCINCHSRDGEGGIGLDLADRMKRLEKAENADDVQPPRLTGIGHKARTPWLTDVLLNKGRARPWMTLRMPQYGGALVGGLPVQLAHIEGVLPDDAVGKGTFAQDVLEVGKTLAGKNGHGCISCHDISGVVGGGTRGPDLALTSQRVRFEWFERWMHNPQRLAPGTKMPSVYVDGKALLTKYYDGDSGKQNAALWAYFALGPGLPLPFGLEPPRGLIIAVKQRPEILRTFLPDGAGTRAIAVGYPDGVNIAFDGHAARLNYVWQGNFLDASPVWNNRGGAPAKLLGPKILTSPAGNPWAVAAGPAPDFAKRADDPAYGAEVPLNTLYPGPMLVKFGGYATDAAGLPTFRYSVSEVSGATLSVIDTPTPAKSSVSTGLKRTFSVDVPEGLTGWYMAGETKGEVRPVPNKPALVYPTDSGRAVLIVIDGPPKGVKTTKQPGPNGTNRVLFALSAGKQTFAVTTWALAKDDPALIDAVLAGK